MRVYQFRHIRVAVTPIIPPAPAPSGGSDVSRGLRLWLDTVDSTLSGYDRAILRRALCLLLLTLALLLPGSAAARPAEPAAAPVRVIVALDEPAAARALATGAGRDALRSIDVAQRRALARILAASPTAEVSWRYRIVLDGLALTLPPGDVARVAALPGVAAVYPSVRYQALGGAPELIGAPAIWGAGLENAGRGIKIGIIDDGIDPSHPFFDPSGYSMPEGFPRGDSSFTSAKVIVARAFAPPDAGWPGSARPFDAELSFHGTHVAGIAAGDAGTVAPAAGGRPRTQLSGVAPLAYLGNYKALTVPTASGVGLNGNSPEIVAAIEAAVADGMDVINLSLGEPEIDPARDAVAKALDNAAAAGVVPVVAAGNDFGELGVGSVGSPGTSARAITVGAAETASAMASFSASGPTPLGLLAKPDVSAPGVDILSSVPGDDVRGALRNEHGGAAGRRGSGAAARGAPRLDGRAGQVRARPHRTGSGRCPEREAGRRARRSPRCDEPLALRLATEPRIRAGGRLDRQHRRNPHDHARGRWGRVRSNGRFASLVSGPATASSSGCPAPSRYPGSCR